MKKKIIPIIVLLLILNITACSLVPENESSLESSSTASTVSQATPTPAPTPDVSSTVSPSPTPVIEPDEGFQGPQLPEIEGSEEFVKAFSENEIDSMYISEISVASSTNQMANVTLNYSMEWKEKVENSINILLDNLSEDDKTQKESEFNDWENEISQEINDIREDAGEGSTALIEAEYQIMIIYRAKAAEIQAEIFEITGAVNFEEQTALG